MAIATIGLLHCAEQRIPMQLGGANGRD